MDIRRVDLLSLRNACLGNCDLNALFATPYQTHIFIEGNIIQMGMSLFFERVEHMLVFFLLLTCLRVSAIISGGQAKCGIAIIFV